MGQLFRIKDFPYVYGEPEIFEVDAHTMNTFLKNDIILNALMKAGVHNWQGFDDAMEAAKKELK